MARWSLDITVMFRVCHLPLNLDLIFPLGKVRDIDGLAERVPVFGQHERGFDSWFRCT